MSYNYFKNGVLNLIAGKHPTDKALSATSNHPVANRVITKAFNDKVKTDVPANAVFTDTTTGTTYAAGSTPNDTHFGTNGSILNAYKYSYNKLELKQISDDNAFSGQFHVLYDWNGYLAEKTGVSIPNYTAILKLPAADVSYHKILAIDASGQIHVCRANAANRTIQLLRTIS